MPHEIHPVIHLSTVLFVDGHPVTYALLRMSQGVRLVPDSLLALCRPLPEIEAVKQNGRWLLAPALPRDLADQVLEDLERM